MVSHEVVKVCLQPSLRCACAHVRSSVLVGVKNFKTKECYELPKM